FLEYIYLCDNLIFKYNKGSGKTTQLPQYILNELEFHSDSDDNTKIKKKHSNRISIAVTQPRRIAAIAAAQQVCREYNGTRSTRLLGKEIGYKIRFENVTTPNVTKLTYMTDGVLLREIIEDPLLLNYNIIIIDEAHERSIETDILLGLMKKACKQRHDLKLLVMSATLNMVKFSDFFDECPIFSIPGRLFDIDIYYQKNLNFASLKSKYVSLAVDTALNIHQNQSLGHILVFLTGQSEIERACKEIKELEKELDYSNFPYNQKLYAKAKPRDSLYIYPIYSVLETKHQKSIFKEVPKGYRKVIFATNIAQTSLTIPGIKYVIDSGFVKQFIYKPELSMDILDVTPISKTAAIQRAGRAGRYSLDCNGKITETGNLMADFPISPYLAKVLLASIKFKCSAEMIIIVSMLSVEDVYISPRGQKKQEEAHKAHSYFHHVSGDHMTMLNIYKQWASPSLGQYSKEWCKQYFLHYRALVTAKNIKGQLELIFQRLNLPILSSKRFTNRPYFYNYKQSTSDTLIKMFNKDQQQELVPLFIHPSSSIHSSSHSQDAHYLEWIIYHHTLFTNRCYLRHVSIINFEWVKDLLAS
ncbi:hypothetical protein PIROE2DRAFT_25174, partial [Piromyces sp. E2]